MKPLVQLYWIRVILGIVAGALSAIVATALPADSINSLIDCITVALIVYLISYYILRPSFREKVEKQSKIMTMGIGMYFFAWIAFFVLFYTLTKTITI